jgi:YidC/Oxa1 family membrane protein insertase
MQKLQPQMNEIRERYKDKPEDMNRAVMELYKRHNVNPLSGCLPMLVQIPIFFGLNAALTSAIEFRHAPFMGWMNDLSAPDRLGSFHIPFVDPAGFPVLTVLMGLSMFAQQKLSPPPTDPSQQTVMMLMPLMFTVMFVNLPSGLALYFLVSNILTIAQQYLINRPAAAKG